MKNIKVMLVLLLALIAKENCDAQSALIPAPQKVAITNNGSLQPASLKYVAAEDTEIPVLYGLLNRLPRIKTTGVGVILKMDSTLELPSDEGYVLDVAKCGAIVKAKTNVGLFYGAVTLNQLINEAVEQDKPIKSLHIEDYTILPSRAVHFDTKHHLDRTEYYHKHLAALKPNADWLFLYMKML